MAISNLLTGILRYPVIQFCYYLLITAGVNGLISDQLSRDAASRSPKFSDHGLSRFLDSAGTRLLFWFLVVLLIGMLVVSGMMAAGYWAFSGCVVSLRFRTGWSALEYRKSLVRGNWWYVALNLYFIAVVAEAPMVAIRFLPDNGLSSEPVIFGAMVLNVVLSSFHTVCATVMFLNLEKVKAGQDSVDAAPDPAIGTGPLAETSDQASRETGSNPEGFDY